ncbi:MAG: hypothetical protein MJ252_05680 [archaeon]|nr:hypothetical protein [archaeon]
MAENKKEPEEAKQSQVATEIIMDLDEGLRKDVLGFIERAFTEQTNLLNMCDIIKDWLQEKEPGKWNVIIGKDFASDIVHRSRKYGLYSVGELSILIWQSGGLETEKK